MMVPVGPAPIPVNAPPAPGLMSTQGWARTPSEASSVTSVTSVASGAWRAVTTAALLRVAVGARGALRAGGGPPRRARREVGDRGGRRRIRGRARGDRPRVHDAALRAGDVVHIGPVVPDRAADHLAVDAPGRDAQLDHTVVHHAERRPRRRRAAA